MSSDPDTRPRAMTEEQVQRVLSAIAGMQGAGARIHVTDRRLSALQSWLIGTGSLLFLAICAWGVLKVTVLSEVIERLVTQNGWLIEQQRDHEIRLRDLERKP